MTIRVAITGFGRIGRNVLRAHYEGGKKHDVEIVAINAPGDLAIHAHLLKHDSCHGRFNADVQVEGTDTLIVNGDRIRVFATRDPKEIPWGELNVDVVMECTGAFNSKEKSMVHIEQGAKKVLLSAPGKTDRKSTRQNSSRPPTSSSPTPPARRTASLRSPRPCTAR